jgi:HEAT repeat protein
MNESLMRRGIFGSIALFTLLATTGTVGAFDYTPTPIAKALAAHELVLVAQVKERAGGMVTIEPVHVIKGKAPDQPITLPDTWRPGTEFMFGPVRFEVGKMYLFMLNGARVPYSLSKDFAAPAATHVKSEKEPLVRATEVLHALAQQEKADGRKEVLVNAWKKEADDTKQKLLQEFWLNPADPATVPFLLRALEAGPDRSNLVAPAGDALVKHKYKEAVPELLKIITNREWTSLYAARALAAQKVADAYEPIMTLITDPKVGNREYLIEALAQLEDRRAIPFFITILPRNIRGLDPAYGTYRSWSFRENEFAVEGLGRLRAKEAVEPLMQLLTLEGAGYHDTRTRVVWALGEIGPPAKKAIPRIRELMQTEHVSKETASEALKKIER